MALYENVFIVRQDVSSAEVDKLTEDFINLVTKFGGTIIKNEYWGLRSLAYEIKNNKKGHYILICIDASPNVIKELEKKLKFSEDIIRYLTINVEEISSESSPILKSNYSENDNIIDVTLN